MARVFYTIDLKSGYGHVALVEASRLLTTFATPYGRYRWLRMQCLVRNIPEAPGSHRMSRRSTLCCLRRHGVDSTYNEAVAETYSDVVKCESS